MNIHLAVQHGINLSLRPEERFTTAAPKRPASGVPSSSSSGHRTRAEEDSDLAAALAASLASAGLSPATNSTAPLHPAVNMSDDDAVLQQVMEESKRLAESQAAKHGTPSSSHPPVSSSLRRSSVSHSSQQHGEDDFVDVQDEDAMDDIAADWSDGDELVSPTGNKGEGTTLHALVRLQLLCICWLFGADFEIGWCLCSESLYEILSKSCRKR